MRTKEEKTTQEQEQEVIALIKSLLQQKDAKGIREDLNNIFYGYIGSAHSDCKRDRENCYSTYTDLLELFTKLTKLNSINRFTA